MKLLAPVLALALLTVAISGCVGGEKRTEWAFEVTQIDSVRADGLTGAGVIIAILDTGIDTRHPSLDHLVDGDETNGEIIAFRDFLGTAQGVSEAFDPDGHGSHVSGIISAKGSSFGDKLVNGGVDLYGAAPNVRLVVARVCDAKGETCDGNAIADAVDWAVNQHNAQIISLSLGGLLQKGLLEEFFGSQDPAVQAMEEAVAGAVSRGVVVVAAAGNDGPDTDDVAFPASIPEVIAVGAMNDDGRVASFSNRGDADKNRCNAAPILDQSRCAPDQKPEVVAPGTFILSAWSGDQYVRASGTSQATPFVAAVIALMLEDKPRLRNAAEVNQVKRVLMDTALELNGQDTPHDRAAGYGLVQAQSAVQAFGGKSR